MSLLPSATEIVYALDLQSDLVGVTFECDEPPAARALPGATTLSRPPLRPWPALLVPLLAAAAPGAAMALDRGAAAPVLVARPAFAAPEGCELMPGTGPLAGRATAAVRCGPRTWRLTLQVLPERSTGAAMADARQALVGPLDAENATVRPVSGLPPGAGSWQVVVAQEPPRVTGFSVWVHGTPARGGLAQRLAQARDSVLGTPVPPVLMVAALDASQPMGERDTSAAIAELARVIAAQPDGTGEITHVTGSNFPPLPR